MVRNNFAWHAEKWTNFIIPLLSLKENIFEALLLGKADLNFYIITSINNFWICYISLVCQAL